MKFFSNSERLIPQSLLALLIFAVPTNLFKIIDDSVGYVSGLQIDYLIPKLYFSDILLILLAFSLAYIQSAKKRLQTFPVFGAITLGILAILQLFGPEPSAGILFVLRVTLLLFIGLQFLSEQIKPFLLSKVTQLAFIITICFQAGVGLLQFFRQSSVASYWFLGETNLLAFAGIAKGTWGDFEYILPYGTTAHPNILAGTVTILFLIYLFNFFNRTSKDSLRITLSFLVISGVIVILTQSFSAGLSLLIGLFLYFFPGLVTKLHRKAVPIAILVSLGVGILLTQVDLQSDSLKRRAYLNSAAITAFEENPSLGVGIQQFSGVVEQYSPVAEVVRFTQPAHNIPLLVMAELGIIGLFLIGVVLHELKKAYGEKLVINPELLLASIPLLALDHYLYTIQTGLLLSGIIALYSFKQK